MNKRYGWLRILVLIVTLALMTTPVAAQGVGETSPGGDMPSTIVEAGQIRTEDLVVLNGLAHIEEGATVQGEVAMMTGELLIDGHVTGDVVAFSGLVTLGPTAFVEGDVIAFGGLDQHPDAYVGGRITRTEEGEGAENALSRLLDQAPGGAWLQDAARPAVRGPQWLASRLGLLLVALLAAWAIVTVLPQNVAHVTDIMTQSTLLSLGTGLLTLVVVALLGTFMSVICIGLPVALALGLGLLVAIVLGWVSTGSLLGEHLCRLLGIDISSKPARAVIGSALITLLSLTPWVGWLLALGIQSWSVGAVLLTRYGTRPDSQWASDLGRRVASGGHHHVSTPAPQTAPPPAVAPSPQRDTHKLSPESLSEAMTSANAADEATP